MMTAQAVSSIDAGRPSPARALLAKVENVQYLRAVAALIVVYSHVVENLSKATGAHAPLFISGPFGVEIFFVISGFIITHTSLDRFGGVSNALQFANHRFWRITPLYWMISAVYLVVCLAAPTVLFKGFTSATHTVASFFFWPMLNREGVFEPLLAAGWSLNYEMLFYVVFAVAMCFPRKFAVPAIFLMFGALALLRPVFPANSVLDFWSRPFLFEFLTGAGIALLARWTPLRLPFVAFAPILLLLLGVASALYGWGAKHFIPTFASVAVASLIVASAVFSHDAARENLVLRFFSAVGNASYSLYLVHMFGVRLCIKALQAAHLLNRIPWPITALICILSALALSWASYKLLERGLIPRVRKQIERRLAPPAPARARAA
jgi:exopolysaccharide production protein ExoZ